MHPSSGGAPAPLVPNMTSASTPAPFLVTTSDNIANPGYPWQAFGGGSYHLFDHQQYYPMWISIILDKKYYLKQYKVNFNGGRAPNSYQILGSNDGVDWYEIIGITGNTVEQVIKSVVTDVAYSQYRINMLSGNPSNGQKPGIINLQYYGVPA